MPENSPPVKRAEGAFLFVLKPSSIDAGKLDRTPIEKALAERTVPATRKDRKDLALWQKDGRVHGEEQIRELQSAFQAAILGVDGEPDKSPIRQRVSPDVLTNFGQIGFVTGGSSSPEIRKVRIVEINLIVPLAEVALLSIAWEIVRKGGERDDKGDGATGDEKTDQGQVQTAGWTLDDVEEVLNAARHTKAQGSVCGIVLYRRDSDQLRPDPKPARTTDRGSPNSEPVISDRWGDVPCEHAKCLGEELAKATWSCVRESEGPLEPASFGSLLEWLIDGTSLDLIDDRRACHLITAVELDVEDGAFDFDSTMFRLRRGYNRRYLPTTDKKATRDEVWRPRRNRAVGLSIEGTAQLVWSDGDAFDDFDPTSRFKGVYRELASLAILEQAMLQRRVDELAWIGNGMLYETHELHSGEGYKPPTEELLRRTIGQLLIVTGTDCGGIGDYRRFYRGLRNVLGLDELLADVRSGLKDIGFLLEREQARVEAAHAAEVERIGRAREEQEKASRDAIEAHYRMREGQHQGLERLVLYVTMAIMPFALLQGFVALFPNYLAVDRGSVFQEKSVIQRWGILGIAMVFVWVITTFAQRKRGRD